MNKFELSPLNVAFKKHLSNPVFDRKKPLFIVGVSGGPDSMALLYLLHRHDFNPVVVHCNYGLRGEQSDKDQRMVEQVCMLWNLECVSVKPERDTSGTGNFQLWARKERYRIFRELKKEFEAQYILTAHHQDDQIETILQKILRGAGISALTGIDAFRGDLFRPLLEVTKAQILEFVQVFNIPYRIDASNEESTYARNFLRNRWFPLLEDLFPGWRTNILSLSEKAAVHQDLIEIAADKIRHDRRSFRRSSFNSLKDNLKPVLFKALFDKAFKKENLNKGFLENIQTLEELHTGQSVDISVKFKLYRDRDLYYFLSKSDSEKILTETELKKEDLVNGFRVNNISITTDSAPKTMNSSELVLDIGKVKFPITIRIWESGDLFKPFGMRGTQLVSDHLTNRKVASHRKNKALVMESFDGMIAAVIFPPEKERVQPGTISENVRVGKSTQQIIKIEIIQ